MIWWVVIYWLVINTMGVGVIVGSVCPIKKKTDASPVKNDALDTEEIPNKEYSPDYFKNMVEVNETNAMNKILKGMSNYFANRTSNSVYSICWDEYKEIPFSRLSETFNKYGMKILTLCDDEFTHEDYCKRRTIRVKMKEKEIDDIGATYMKG